MDLSSIFKQNDFFLTINSEEQLDLYPSNLPYDFTYLLPAPLSLNDGWRVALWDLVWHNRFAKNDTEILRMSIECNFVQPSIVYGTKRQCIGTVPILTARESRASHRIIRPMYVKTIDATITEMQFYIRRENGELVTSFIQDLSFTLHFKQ